MKCIGAKVLKSGCKSFLISFRSLYRIKFKTRSLYLFWVKDKRECRARDEVCVYIIICIPFPQGGQNAVRVHSWV